MSPEERGSQFLKAVADELPFGGRAIFDNYAGPVYLELTDLEAEVPGNKWGTRAMEVITRLADFYAVNLVAIPRGEPGDDLYERLAAFYGRFGFAGEDALHRPCAGS